MSAAGGSVAVPDALQVKVLLGMLFDGFAAKPGKKLDTSPKSNTYFGVYASDSGTVVALCGCDMAFATASGAALSMLPPSAAKEAAKEKGLTAVMSANLHEVMNICTRLLLREDSAHLRLHQLCAVAALPPPAADILRAPRGRADFEVVVGRYGLGSLSIFCL